MNQPRYVSVDELQASVTLPEAAAKCSVPLDVHGAGKQVRLDCPFGCSGDHGGKREIAVDTSNPQKVFCCHAYGCQVRGNLLMLMHGWLTGTLPVGGKLKGAEFKRVRDVLTGGQTSTVEAKASPAPAAERAPSDVIRNIPLAQSDNEKARELATLDEKFVADVATMPPAAAMYVRRHTCLSPAAMQKWRIGVMPGDGGGDKRAWSLRGQILYPILSEDGQVLAWVARDPQFESKEIAFNALSAEARAKEKSPPHKHRFPVGFARGQELFGQQAARLKEPGYRESIGRIGIIVVEGFNDVLGLDALAVPSVAIMSNKITTEQVSKIERFARNLAGGKVSLLFDADHEGDNGVKESLWLLAQRGLDVRLGWSRAMHGGQFDSRQPESLTEEEWRTVIRPAIER